MFGTGIPRRPRRAGRTADQTWDRLASVINSANGRTRPAERPAWQWIAAGMMISIAIGWVAKMVTRANVHQSRRRSGSAGQIEFIDVDRPGTPVSRVR